MQQALDVVGYLVKPAHQALAEAVFAPPLGKARLLAMPWEMAAFSWQRVVGRAVWELELPSSDERRQRLEESLARFKDTVGERAYPYWGLPRRATPTSGSTRSSFCQGWEGPAELGSPT